jgi:hypothetical protein
MGKAKLKSVELPKLKLDLGCGKNKKPGFLGVDSRKFDGVDWVADLRAEKWEIRPGDSGMTGGCVTAISGKGWMADGGSRTTPCLRSTALIS